MNVKFTFLYRLFLSLVRSCLVAFAGGILGSEWGRTFNKRNISRISANYIIIIVLYIYEHMRIYNYLPYN